MGSKTAIGFIWTVVILVSIWAFYPGLSGPFLFDDYGTLPALGKLGGINSWETFKVYVFGGSTGPTGRPISLFTFAINAQDWPASPLSFKITNLFLHISIGTGVYILIFKVLDVLSGYSLTSRSSNQCIALAASTIWLLHPFLVSTVLYVVQRMTQLSTLFMVFGLIGYISGRTLIKNNGRLGYVWMTLSLTCGTLFATFSKENGVLLPLLALVIEFTAFSSQANVNHRPLNKSWFFVFLIAPSVCIVACLLYFGMKGSFFFVIEERGFSQYERLLTQSRVLVDYIRNWFIPSLFTSGLFHDDYQKSLGFLSPASTLLSFFFHMFIVSIALLRRAKWPLFSLSVLFFYAGHLIESTTIPIELYFEHRNYLPVIFLSVPALCFVQNRISNKLFGFGVIASLLILATFTYLKTGLWSSESKLMLTWAEKAPNSPRAQQQASLTLHNLGESQKAIELLASAMKRMPDNFQLLLWKQVLECTNGISNTDDLAHIEELASKTLYKTTDRDLYQLFVNTVVQRRCELKAGTARKIFIQMLQHSRNQNAASIGYAHINLFLGDIYLSESNIKLAMEYYLLSLNARQNPHHAMKIASGLATKGYYTEAIVLSDIAVSYLNKGSEISSGQSYKEVLKDISLFQNQVRNDMKDFK